MKLVVFGATGGTGRAAIAAAVARGDQVTAFARRPDRLRRADLRVIEGDALDAGAVAGAIQGQDAVLSVLGAPPWRHGEVCERGTRNIVDAMRQHSVRRLVVVSQLGAAESRQHLGWMSRRVALPLLLGRGLGDKERMEEIVRGSDLDWLIVRPALLTSGLPRGSWRVAVDGSIHGGFITRADLASFCVVQLTSDQYLHQSPSLA